MSRYFIQFEPQGHTEATHMQPHEWNNEQEAEILLQEILNHDCPRCPINGTVCYGPKRMHRTLRAVVTNPGRLNSRCSSRQAVNIRRITS